MSSEDLHDPMPEGAEPPPRGVRLMGAFRWMILAGSIALALFAWWTLARADLGRGGPSAGQRVRYHCPMHPQIVQDEPGECPICHMTLEPFTPATPAAPSAAPSTSASAPSASASAPSTSASAPAPSASTPAHPGAHAGHTTSAAPSAAPAASALPAVAPTLASGLATVELELDRVQAIGVRTATATEREVRGGIRVTAVVAAPEQGASEVHVRASGFVEKISIEETGVSVSEGQPLFSLYSPEILQAQAELLASRRWASGDAGGDVTLEAGRRKLALLGMGDKDIERVLATNEPLRAIPVYAPRGGVVTRKSVVLGSRVTPEMALYELVDLSRVYVTASLFPRDAAKVQTGMEARFTAAGQPGSPVTGKIDLIYPGVQPESRTTRVRMVLPNDKRRFTPGEYGTVEIATPARRAVLVPRDAVVDTGDHAHVFVVTGPGRFSPRAVATGEIDGDGIAIATGLAAGDRVVSGATFLIDAESRLQGSLAASGGR